MRLEANHQIQVLSSLFFRNRTAYVVGRIVNGYQAHPFVVPIKHDADGNLYADALLMDAEQLALLFSANRAYFLVDMEVPSAYVTFLRHIVPERTEAELYTMVGLQKQGKTLFFRDFLHHLKHSTDDFVLAPGIKGMVMTVFTLPSYPYVFKVIKDRIAPSKDTTRDKVKEKYVLVKHHDRVGRMADTLEYSDVAFPRARFSAELMAELEAVAPSTIEKDGDMIVVKHLYIERRMTPLNLFLERATPVQREHAMSDYGDALKQLAAVNIFAGDLLFKNFGVTRYGRIVFYDYDEIEYLTACTFRHIPRLPPGRTTCRATSGTRSGRTTSSPRNSPPFCSPTARCARISSSVTPICSRRKGGRRSRRRSREASCRKYFPIPRRCASRTQAQCCPARRRGRIRDANASVRPDDRLARNVLPIACFSQGARGAMERRRAISLACAAAPTSPCRAASVYHASALFKSFATPSPCS